MWKYAVGAVVTGGITYGLYRYYTGGICNCPTRLDDSVIIITGGSSGIGQALAAELVQRGAIVVLACRNVEKGINAKAEIISKLSDSNVKILIKYLDLTKFSSILKFVEAIKSEFKEIYALVNNAAVFWHPVELTEDGYEVTFQTNYLGPFVLTHHLLPLLKKADHARIVNVASEAHRKVNVYDLKAVTKCQNEFRSHLVAYGVSKLALVLFTRHLYKKLINTNIIVNAADPGNVETPIYRHFPPLKNRFLYAVQWPVRLIIIKNPHQGAQTLLHCLLTTNRSTGQYYRDCKLALPSPLASNDKLAKEYYELTLEILADKFATESDC